MWIGKKNSNWTETMKLFLEINPSDRNLRNFGFLFSGIFLALAIWLFYKSIGSAPWFLGLAACFLLLAFVGRAILKPIYIGWMSIAVVLAWINTRIILGLTFFLIFTPMGIIARLLGKDLLQERIDKNASSYWIAREESPMPKSRYQQMF